MIVRTLKSQLDILDLTIKQSDIVNIDTFKRDCRCKLVQHAAGGGISESCATNAPFIKP